MDSSKHSGAVRATRGELVRGVLVSLVVASVLLLCAVLPAEYGIDPTGAGKAMGLTTLNAPAVPVAAKAITAAPVPTTAPEVAGAADPHAKKPDTVANRETAPYQVATREIVLQPGSGVELKARMDKGAALIYAWKTKDGSKIHHEFHGDPAGAQNDEYESYIKDDAVSASKGALVAPFTGVHGWYWKNESDKPVTVLLQASGFYTELFNP